jgi:hypothetical protein
VWLISECLKIIVGLLVGEEED